MPIINGTPIHGGCVSVSLIPTVGGPLNPLNAIPGAKKVISALGIANIIGVENITYSWRVERTAVKGSGNVQRSIFTPGMLYFNNSTISLWLTEFNNLVNQCGGILSFSLLTDFTVEIKYRNSFYLPLSKVKLKNCRMVNVTSNNTMSSPDNILVDMEFQVGEIEIDGKSILNAIASGVGIGNELANLI